MRDWERQRDRTHTQTEHVNSFVTRQGRSTGPGDTVRKKFVVAASSLLASPVASGRPSLPQHSAWDV